LATDREVLSSMSASTLEFLGAEKISDGRLVWCNFSRVISWADACLLLNGDVSFSNGSIEMGKLGASHIGGRVTRQVTYDSLAITASVDLYNLIWNRYGGLSNASAATVYVNVGRNVCLGNITDGFLSQRFDNDQTQDYQ